MSRKFVVYEWTPCSQCKGTGNRGCFGHSQIITCVYCGGERQILVEADPKEMLLELLPEILSKLDAQFKEQP